MDYGPGAADENCAPRRERGIEADIWENWWGGFREAGTGTNGTRSVLIRQLQLEPFPYRIRRALQRALFVEYHMDGHLGQKVGHFLFVLEGRDKASVLQQRQNLHGNSA